MQRLPVIPLILLLGVIHAFAFTSTIHGQSAAEEEVRGMVTALFDAMRTADGERAGALFHPDARLLSIGERNGVPVLSSTPAADFVRAIGTPRTEIWDERISGLEIRVDGNMATAWMNYGFFLGGQFSHCGVNAFQFFRDADGWRIIQVTDTRRQQPCDGWI